MPASARSALIDLSLTNTYHCVTRCVRRAYLCGDDPYSGKNLDHRKSWLVERARELAGIFTVDVCAYAVLGDHYHIVLRADEKRGTALSDEAVLRRYGKLSRTTATGARALAGRPRSNRIGELRARLIDVSWFVRSINEHMARRSNKEDEVSGRFWEGRFRSQVLLDDTALITAMSYVDLNPIRLGLCDRLEDSARTSIGQRLREANGQTSAAESVPLAAFISEPRSGSGPALPMRFDDYIELLRWTAKAVPSSPGGRIRRAPPAALTRLGLDVDAWLETMVPGGLKGYATLGTEASLAELAEQRGKRWLRGKRLAAALYREK